MKRYSSLLTVILLTALVASAQTEADLKRHFEGRHVTLKIDMPATEVGVNGEYVDLSDNDDEDGGDDSSMRNTSYEFGPRVVSVGPRTTYLKEGLSEQEVLRLLGRPSLSIRAADKPADTIHEFPRGEGRHILAEFRDGVLVRARTVDRGQLVRADAAK